MAFDLRIERPFSASPAEETSLNSSLFLILNLLPIQTSQWVVAERSRMFQLLRNSMVDANELSLRRYPKEVWSPAGGWYSRPANWKANTAVMGAFVIGIAAMAFSLSADREYRDKMPEPGRFFPSR